MDAETHSSGRGNWPVIVISGLDSAARSQVFRALGAGGHTVDDLGVGLGVSLALPAGLDDLLSEIRVIKGVRVSARPNRAAKWDAVSAGTELAKWLTKHQTTGFLVLDGVAESMGDNLRPFIETMQAQIVNPITTIIGLEGGIRRTEIAAPDAGNSRDLANPWQQINSQSASETLASIVDASVKTLAKSGFTGLMISDTSQNDVAPRPERPGGRNVNSRICERNTENDVSLAEGLQHATAYDLLTNIGQLDPRSILKSEFPDERLPKGGVWLQVMARALGSTRQSVVRNLYLPESGDSFICRCPVHGPHSCREQDRDNFARFPFKTPASGSIMTLLVTVYYKAAVVHVHEIALLLGSRMQPTFIPETSYTHDELESSSQSASDEPRATSNVNAYGQFRAETLYTLTHSFSDLGPWANHTLSFFSTGPARGSQAQVYVEGVSFRPLTYKYNDAGAQNAATRFRKALFDAHLEPSGSEWQTKYKGLQHRKGDLEYQEDLLTIAKHGSLLFHSLFRKSDWVLIDPFLKDKKALGATTLQFVRLETESLGLPWQQVYDLGMESRETLETVHVCASVHDFGPSGHEGPFDSEAPSTCPYTDEHPNDRSVLCPFGFWGLAYVLEAPPDIGEQRSLPHYILRKAQEAIVTVVGWNPDMDHVEAHRHLGNLQSIGLGLTEPPLTDKDELKKRLGPSTLDVVYLYCHGERDRPPGSTSSDPALALGPEPNAFTPGDVMQWSTTWVEGWGYPHWADRRPLVILNTCHSGETRPDMLSNFVDAFVVTAGASGVLATEITVEQSVAGLAMELFLERFRTGESAGHAIRGMRWDMLSRGNILGFAYSPYCAADLKIRALHS